MTEHTPGPWYYFPTDKSRTFRVCDNPQATKDGVGLGAVMIADVIPISEGTHHEANARLICAAPALRDACANVADWLDSKPMLTPDEESLLDMLREQTAAATTPR